MGLAEKLEMFVSLDPSQGVAGLERLSKSAEDNVGKTETAMKRVGAAATKLGVAGVGVGGFLTQLGSKEQAAGQQLETSIANVGQSYDEFKDRISKTSDEQAKFGHTNVEVDNALSTLTLSYNDAGKALDQMQLVADLAAKKQISLEDAANLVAKAHGGAAKMFKEFGIKVKENADGTKNYDGALTELAGKLSGQASAATDTWTGKLGALRAEIENQVAAFGEKYGPAIMAGSAALTAFGGVASGVAAVQRFAAGANAAAAFAAADAAAANDLLAASDALVTENSMASVSALYAQSAAEDEAGASSIVAAGALSVLAVGAAAVVYGLSQAGQSATEFHITADIGKSSTDDLVKSFRELGNSTAEGSLSYQDFQQIANTNIGTAQRLRDALAAQGVDVSSLDEILGKAAESQKQMSTDQQAGTATSDALTGSVKEQKKALDEAAKAADGYSGFIGNLATAMDKQYQGTFAASIVTDSFESSSNSLVDTLKKEGFTLDNASTAHGKYNTHALANIAALQATGESIAKVIEQRFQETHSIDDATNAGQMYVDGLREQLTQAGYNTTQIDEMIATMHLTPKDIATTFTTNGVEAEAVVQQYVKSFADIPHDVQTDIAANIDAGAYEEAQFKLALLAQPRTVQFTVKGLNDAYAEAHSYDNLPGYDSGGFVPGPRGKPQLAVVHGGEFVMTADEAAGRGKQSSGGSMAIASGGGVTFAPVINVSSLDPSGAARAVGEALREFVRTYPVPDAIKQAFQN